MYADRRVALLRELVRVCRPGGVILVQAWAREQEGVQGRSFDFQKGDSQVGCIFAVAFYWKCEL